MVRVTITGEHGAGKTAIAYAVAKALRASGLVATVVDDEKPAPAAYAVRERLAAVARRGATVLIATTPAAEGYFGAERPAIRGDQRDRNAPDPFLVFGLPGSQQALHEADIVSVRLQPDRGDVRVAIETRGREYAFYLNPAGAEPCQGTPFATVDSLRPLFEAVGIEPPWPYSDSEKEDAKEGAKEEVACKRVSLTPLVILERVVTGDFRPDDDKRAQLALDVAIAFDALLDGIGPVDEEGTGPDQQGQESQQLLSKLAMRLEQAADQCRTGPEVARAASRAAVATKDAVAIPLYGRKEQARLALFRLIAAIGLTENTAVAFGRLFKRPHDAVNTPAAAAIARRTRGLWAVIGEAFGTAAPLSDRDVAFAAAAELVTLAAGSAGEDPVAREALRRVATPIFDANPVAPADADPVAPAELVAFQQSLSALLDEPASATRLTASCEALLGLFVRLDYFDYAEAGRVRRELFGQR